MYVFCLESTSGDHLFFADACKEKASEKFKNFFVESFGVDFAGIDGLVLESFGFSALKKGYIQDVKQA